MRESTLRTTVGLFLVFSHFLVIGLVILFYFRHGFLFDEMTTSEALIVPVFAGYTTVIVNRIIAQRKDQVQAGVDQKLSAPFVLLSFFFPILLVTYLILIVVLKAFNNIADFEKFKALLGLGETLFAVYVGMFIKSLFEP